MDPLTGLHIESVVRQKHPSVVLYEINRIKNKVNSSLIPEISEIDSRVAHSELLHSFAQ